MGGLFLGIVGVPTIIRWVACFNFLFMVETLRLLPMVVMGFWRGFVMSSFGGERVGWVGIHNTMGCMMGFWCGIIFMWG